jgi:hypothetical protein
VTIELVNVRDMVFPLEDVRIMLNFPENFQNSSLSTNIGEFDFEKEISYLSNKSNEGRGRAAYWNISKIDKDQIATLKGNVTHMLMQQKKEDKIPFPLSKINTSSVLTFACKIDKFSLIGGGVNKVVISKNPKKLDIFKGGRNNTFIKNLEIVF